MAAGEGEEQDEGEDGQKERAELLPVPTMEEPGLCSQDPCSCSQACKQSVPLCQQPPDFFFLNCTC